MDEQNLPNIGEVKCIACNDEVHFAMFWHEDEEAVNSSKLGPGWICWNCAHERGIPDGTSLAGALTWCLGCHKPVYWDDGNSCPACPFPADVDQVYCDDCWSDESDDWHHKKPGVSFETLHENCG